MTEPIREKFEGLDDNLQTRHNALMDLLAGIALQLEPPIDYSAGFASLGQKLDAILAALVDPFDGGAPVLSQLTAMRTDLSYLAGRIDLVGDKVVITNGWLDSIMDTVGVKAPGAEFTLASLTRAQAATLITISEQLEGLVPPWPANVLAALQCICDATSSQLPIDPLDETQQPPNCVAHYVSSGQNLFPPVPPVTLTGIIYATWEEPLPEGLEYGTILLGDLGDGILTTTDWSQWAVFVKSDEPQYADDPAQPERYPTNQWRTMEGSGARVFSVSERGSIEVHFCKLNPYQVAEGECLEFADNTTFQDQRAFAIPAELPDTYTLSASDNFYRWALPDDYIGGPINAGFPMTIGDLRAGGATILQFGSSPFDPAVVVTICNPEPV